MRPLSAYAVTLRVSALVGALFAISTAALGWMYWLAGPTAGWRGPREVDVLPLDELAHHQDVSVLIFVVTMAVTGFLAGLVARALRFDGFAISLLVGAGVGGWLYLESAISLFVVRQSTLDVAFGQTRHLAPIYLTGVLYAAAVALIARRATGDQWLTRLLPASVGLVGIIEILTATLPHSVAVEQVLGGLITGATVGSTRTAEVMLGILLLSATRGLGRRSHRAFMLATVLLVVTLVVRIVDSPSVLAVLVVSTVIVGLIARRADFHHPGDPVNRTTGIRHLGTTALVTLAYGEFALFVNQTVARQTFKITSAFRETVYALLIGAPSQALLISGDFAEWFPWSLRVIVIFGIIRAVSSWTGPWRHRLSDQSDRGRHARSLVALYGEDTLAPFSLRQDKAWYFYPTDPDVAPPTTLLAYRVVRGVALVSGDPIGPRGEIDAAVTAFRARCAQRGWRFAILGVGNQHLDLYAGQGLRAIYHGDEASVDTESFSLSGGAMKSVRQAANRVARKGFESTTKRAGELSLAEREELLALESRWLAGGERKGFVMELDQLFRSDGDEAVFVIGRDASGVLRGFLEVAVCPASSSLSLSSMPRDTETPNGFNAFLIVSAIEWARENGYRTFSLNFAPFARYFAREGRNGVIESIVRAALRASKRVLNLQLDNLVLFNRQFSPQWRPRYVVIARFRDIPAVLVAAMAAERYLPFADLLRGRDWTALRATESPTVSSSP